MKRYKLLFIDSFTNDYGRCDMKEIICNEDKVEDTITKQWKSAYKLLSKEEV